IVHGSYLQDWLMYDTDFNWRLAGDTGGKSRAIADIGSHWCDTVQYVTGKRITSVFADLWTVHPIRKKSKNHQTTFSANKEALEQYEEIAVSTEDYASVLIRFEDGARGVFRSEERRVGKECRSVWGGEC